LCIYILLTQTLRDFWNLIVFKITLLIWISKRRRVELIINHFCLSANFIIIINRFFAILHFWCELFRFFDKRIQMTGSTGDLTIWDIHAFNVTWVSLSSCHKFISCLKLKSIIIFDWQFVVKLHWKVEGDLLLWDIHRWYIVLNSVFLIESVHEW
jgi:hypothetical protein